MAGFLFGLSALFRLYYSIRIYGDHNSGGIFLYVTVDLGASTLKSGVFEHTGNLLVRHRCDSSNVSSKRQLIDLLRDQIDELIINSRGNRKDLTGIGIAVPGFVPVQTDTIPVITNLGLNNIDLKDALSELYTCNIVVENDANMAAWGEYKYGAAKQNDNVLMLTIGTGIGGGIILNKELLRGKLGLTGEVGHVQVRPVEGRQCNCGRIGCLETESSGSAIEYYADIHMDGHKTAKEVIELAKSDDPDANNVLNNATYYLALALANTMHIFEFDRVVLGGGVSLGGSLILRKTRRYLERFMSDAPQFRTEIVVLSELGNDAGLWGLYDSF